MQYGIFKRSVTVNGSDISVSFSPLQNPGVPHKILEITADNIEEAAREAADLLKRFGVQTHRRMGDPDLIMADFPDYFVGKIETKLADDYDTAALAFHIHTFTPVPQHR